MATAEYDVIIVGGGIVGAAFAAALPRSLKIAILEVRTPEKFQVTSSQYDSRVSAINRASQNILTHIGAWSDIQNARITPYYKMRVWDASGEGAINFDCKNIGAENLGYIIENGVIQTALLQQIERMSNITWHSPVKCHSLIEQENEIVITIEDGHTLRSKLLIGADGGQSWVRTRAGMSVVGWDYGQSAIVATVKTGLPHQNIAWQRFLPTGPLAFLPLEEPHTESIVWSTTPEHAQVLLDQDEKTFCSQLGEALDHRLGSIEFAKKRLSFPLKMSYAQNTVKPHLALIGDAAHTIHPLAGQGINLGLLDAACLSEVITDAISLDRNFSSLETLRRYERWRKTDNMMMITAMEVFKRTFECSFSPVIWARNFALNITDQSEWLKNFFIQRAMGISGDLPTIAK